MILKILATSTSKCWMESARQEAKAVNVKVWFKLWRGAIGRVKIRGVNLAVEWVDGEKEERGDDGWTEEVL